MSDQPIVGELMLWAGPRIPGGWERADGRLLRIMEYQMLFTLIGDRFGGDGRQTFALPDVQKDAQANKGLTWCIAVDGVYPSFP